MPLPSMAQAKPIVTIAQSICVSGIVSPDLQSFVMLLCSVGTMRKAAAQAMPHPASKGSFDMRLALANRP